MTRRRFESVAKICKRWQKRCDRETRELLDVIKAARAGDQVADRALRDAALECLSRGRPMPAPLTDYVMRIVMRGG